MLSLRQTANLTKFFRLTFTDLRPFCISRHFSDDWNSRPIVKASERARSVTSFYYQSAIDNAAKKPVVRLMPSTLLYSGKRSDGSHLLRSAQYLHKELPVRIAHCITAFRRLPFIVGCNPSLLSIHELYISSFHEMADFPAVDFLANLSSMQRILYAHIVPNLSQQQITDSESEIRYSYSISKLLDDHKDVVKALAEGFKETTKHISDESLVKTFLDMLLTSRLAIRLLCEHHLHLHEDRPNQIGVIQVHFHPKTFIEKKAEFARSMCEEKYGVSPDVHVRGHVAVTFPYIPPPLDYILNELLKNAMRATVESHPNTSSGMLPPIVVTLANNDADFIIRISDMGGGVQHDIVKKIWKYGFTTSEMDQQSDQKDYLLFQELTENRSAGRFHGYGFGLPACKAFVEYMGGMIHLETMQGMGTDVFVRLSHIDGKMASFRI